MQTYQPATGFNSGYGSEYNPYGSPTDGHQSISLGPSNTMGTMTGIDYSQLPRPSTPPLPIASDPRASPVGLLGSLPTATAPISSSPVGLLGSMPTTQPLFPVNADALQSGLGIGAGRLPAGIGLGSPGFGVGGIGTEPKNNNSLILPTANNKITANMTVYQRLDMVTRSRNALILAVIFLSIFFLASFTAALVLAFPDTLLRNIDITVKSTRTDLFYKESDLGSKTSFAYTNMKTTMCTQCVQVAKKAATINDCEVDHFENANPGVRAFIILNTAINGEKLKTLVTKVGEALVIAASTNSVWNIGVSDIGVRTPGILGGDGSGASVLTSIQMPLLLLFTWILHKML